MFVCLCACVFVFHTATGFGRQVDEWKKLGSPPTLLQLLLDSHKKRNPDFDGRISNLPRYMDQTKLILKCLLFSLRSKLNESKYLSL